MSFECIDNVLKSLNLPEEDKAKMLKQITKQYEELNSSLEKNKGLSPSELRKKFVQLIEEKRVDSKRQQYRNAVQVVKNAQIKQKVDNLLASEQIKMNNKWDIREVARAVLSDGAFFGKGSNVGFSVTKAVYQDKEKLFLLKAIEDAGIRDELISGGPDMEREIFNALHGEVTNNPKIQKFVDNMKKYNDRVFVTKRELGADVKYKEGYGISHVGFHNPDKLMSVTEDVWINKILESTTYLDELKERMSFKSDAEALSYAQKELLEDYRKITKAANEEIFSKTLLSDTLKPNVAKKLEMSRSFNFRTPELAYNYYKEFSGTDNLLELLMNQAHAYGNQFALMDMFGPSPSTGIGTFIDHLNDSIPDSNVRKEFALMWKENGELKNLYRNVRGMNYGIHDNLIAKVGDWTSTIVYTNKMATAIITNGILDPVVSAFQTKSRSGKWFLSELGSTWKSLWDSFIDKNEAKEIMEGIGLFWDEQLLDLNEKQITDIKNISSKEVLTFYNKYSGLSAWYAASKASPMKLYARALGKYSDMAYDKLPKMLQGDLFRHGIEAADWDKIRAVTDTRNGNKYIFLDNVADRNAQNLLAGLYRGMSSQINVGTGAVEKSAMIRFEKGTFFGEINRQIAMFKTFGYSMHRAFLKEVRGNPDKLVSKIAGMEMRGDLSRAVQYTMYLMAGAYVSMAIKDIIAGKSPRDPTEDNGLGIVELLAESGAVNPLLNLMLSQAANEHSTWQERALGPTASTIGRMTESIQSALLNYSNGDDDKGNKYVLKAFKEVTPNTAYTKIAFTYALQNEINDMLDPEYNSKEEKRMREDEGWLWRQKLLR